MNNKDNYYTTETANVLLNFGLASAGLALSVYGISPILKYVSADDESSTFYQLNKRMIITFYQGIPANHQTELYTQNTVVPMYAYREPGLY